MDDTTDPATTVEAWKAANERAAARFFAAPGDDRIDIIQGAVVHLATLIDIYVPTGRNKAIALTELESVHFRANRGIHAPKDQR